MALAELVAAAGILILVWIIVKRAWLAFPLAGIITVMASFATDTSETLGFYGVIIIILGIIIYVFNKWFGFLDQITPADVE